MLLCCSLFQYLVAGLQNIQLQMLSIWGSTLSCFLLLSLLLSPAVPVSLGPPPESSWRSTNAYQIQYILKLLPTHSPMTPRRCPAYQRRGETAWASLRDSRLVPAQEIVSSSKFRPARPVSQADDDHGWHWRIKYTKYFEWTQVFPSTERYKKATLVGRLCRWVLYPSLLNSPTHFPPHLTMTTPTETTRKHIHT